MRYNIKEIPFSKLGLEPQSIDRRPPKPDLIMSKDHRLFAIKSTISLVLTNLLPKALRHYLTFCQDEMMIPRLYSRMQSCRFDRSWCQKMKRDVYKGNTELLHGFPFNVDSSFSSLIKVPYSYDLNLDNATGSFYISPFSPAQDIVWPEESSFCRFKSILVGFDFETRKYETWARYSKRINRKVRKVMNYRVTNLIPNTRYPLLFYCAGIEFFRKTEKGMPLRNIDPFYNPLEIGVVKLKTD